MRVVHVITRLIVGGAQENTIASVRGLREKPGFEVDLVAGPTFGAEGSLESLVADQPRLLTVVPQLVRPLHPWKDWLAFRKLTELFRGRAPEVVHTHSGKAGILGRIAAAKAGVPIILHTIHGPSFGSFQGPIANALFCSSERYAARVTTHFVVVAEAMKQQYLAGGVGRPDQFTTIVSGFPLEPYASATNDHVLRASFGLMPDDVVVGKIARFFKLKGHDDLLAVAPGLVRANPRIKFLLVGDGPWRGRLENDVRARGLGKHVIFAGLVAPPAVPRLVGIMDAVVHLSSREGLARALPQALAAARPIVAYDADGAREVCLENTTGFLLRVGDLQGLHDRLLRLSQDAALRERLGRCGQGFVQQRFGVQRMVDSLHQLYLWLGASLK